MSFCRLVLICVLAFPLTHCSPKAHEAYLPGERREKNRTDNDGTAYLVPKVDILFVIDDSQSMYNHQNNLVRNIQQFISAFVANAVVDYQIGVITTDMDEYSRSGRLVGNTRYVTRNTPNAAQVLGSNLSVGINGTGYETPLEAVRAALHPPLSTGYNLGFLRDDATLVTIFLTDTNGRDNVNPLRVYDELVALKKGNPKKVLGYGAIIPSGYPESRSCERDTEGEPEILEQFLSYVSNSGNNILNLCEPNFGQRLAEFANEIVERVGTTIYLARLPNINSIRVVYGNLDLPRDAKRGWSFDPELNAVKLGPEIDWSSQPQGSQVIVYYTEAGFKP